MEAYQAVKSGDPNAIEEALKDLRRVLEFAVHGPFGDEFGRSKEMHMLMREIPMIIEEYLQRYSQKTDKPRSQKESRSGITGHSDRPAIAGSRSNDSCYQIIIMAFSHFATIKLSRLKFCVSPEIIDKELAINFRGVHLCPAFP